MTEASYEKFYKDWLDSSKKFMAAWQQQSANPTMGTPPQVDFFKEAQSLFERLMWFPPFSMIKGTAGPQLSQYEKYWELYGLYSKLYQEWLNVYLEFSRTLMLTISNTNSKLIGLNLVTQPKEIYTKWIEGLETGIDGLLRDPSFAAKLGSVLSMMLDVRKKSDEFMEGYFSLMNIPTKSEMNRVYKEMYLMKREIRKLSANLNKRSPMQNGGADEEE